MVKKLKVVIACAFVLVAAIGAYASDNAVDYVTAARSNSKLQHTLKWTLGRRSQAGWYLYTELISKQIGSTDRPGSVSFAKKVANWQRSRNIRANGVIGRATLYAFIREWQSRRLRPIRLASERDLLTAPIANFFDPTRSVELLKVERTTFAAYRRMRKAALLDPESGVTEQNQFLTIISSYRSPKYQASLRKREPNASRAQIAFRSPHFTGRALDIYVGGEPVTTKDSNRKLQVDTKAYKWMVKNAEKFGFYPYFYEPWHWEYVPGYR